VERGFLSANRTFRNAEKLIRQPEICKTLLLNLPPNTEGGELAAMGDELIEKLELFGLTQNQASVYAAIIN